MTPNMEKLRTNDRTACPICGSRRIRVVLELPAMPAQDGVMYTTRQAAIDAPVGDITLAICQQCKYIGNLSYDADLINFTEYRCAQHHSQQYRRHVDSVVAALVSKYSVRGKTVIDVGCGEGYFLNELCKAGNNQGIGIDPSLTVTQDVQIDSSRIELIKDFYSKKYSHRHGDLICCRHVIDELASPRNFLQLMASSLGPDNDAIVYLELPNAISTFQQKLIWNIGYAKRSWFTASSLEMLFESCGLNVMSIDSIFEDEYLGIVGRRKRSAEAAPSVSTGSSDDLLSELDDFAQHFKHEIQRWQHKISELQGRRERVAIWGAGMRGINFLHRFADADVFSTIVDINPDRQGSFLPGSGCMIDKPEVLQELQPDRVLVSNPNYQNEIRAELEKMGVACELEVM